MNTFHFEACPSAVWIEGVFSVAFVNLNIRGRLILGFSILCILLAGVVGTTMLKVHMVSEATDRTVNLRVPTAMTASDVVSGVYASLASLRGWLITGNEAFKTERAALWKDIQKHGSELDRLSGQWVVEQNRVDWRQAKPLLDELRNAQDKAEAIAHTIDEQPAAKILATEAAPLVKLMLQKATSIIEEERGILREKIQKELHANEMAALRNEARTVILQRLQKEIEDHETKLLRKELLKKNIIRVSSPVEALAIFEEDRTASHLTVSTTSGENGVSCQTMKSGDAEIIQIPQTDKDD